MTPKQITALKAAVKEYYPDASHLQYHQAFDTVSGHGRALALPEHSMGNIDRWGYGRYILARRMCMPDRWETVGGNAIEF